MYRVKGKESDYRERERERERERSKEGRVKRGRRRACKWFSLFL